MANTEERRIVELSKGPPRRGTYHSSMFIFWILIVLLLLQVAIGTILVRQYNQYHSDFTAQKANRDNAVGTIICVLQMPQHERTDNNVAQCFGIEP